MTMKFSTKKLVITAMLLAVGLVLPTLFHAFGGGSALLPMHIPVLICGFVCGAPYGALLGLVLPLLSSVLTGMPPIFPVAPAMAFELCAYGVVTGLLYRKVRMPVYPALLLGMLAGRAVSGVANAILMGFAGKDYGMTAFLTASFVTALPGIIIQLVVVPLLVMTLTKAGLVEDPRLAPVSV